MEEFTVKVTETARIETASLTFNDSPVRWGYTLYVGREHVASEGLQFGKFATEAIAIRDAKSALRAYLRDKKERAGR